MSGWSAVAMLACGALLAAFFSGAETGAYVLDRLHLRYRAHELGDAWARRLERLLEDTPGFVTAMLLWTNLALDIVSAVCTNLYERTALPVQPEIAATLTAAPLLFVFAELVPKTVFRLRAERMMMSSARVLLAAVWLVRPLARALSAFGRAVRWLLGLAGPRHWTLVSRKAVETAFAAGAEQGALSTPQRHLVQGILRSGSASVAAVGTAVEKLQLMSEDASAAELIARAAALRSPRVFVYRGAPDQVSGVVHVVQAWGVPGATPLSALARPPLLLSDGTTIVQALAALRRAGRSVGLLVAAADTKRAAEHPGADPGAETQATTWRARAVVTVEDLLRYLVRDIAAQRPSRKAIAAPPA